MLLLILRFFMTQYFPAQPCAPMAHQGVIEARPMATAAVHPEPQDNPKPCVI